MTFEYLFSGLALDFSGIQVWDIGVHEQGGRGLFGRFDASASVTVNDKGIWNVGRRCMLGAGGAILKLHFGRLI